LSAIKIDPIPRQQKVQDDPDGHLLYRESDIILERCKRHFLVFMSLLSSVHTRKMSKQRSTLSKQHSTLLPKNGNNVERVYRRISSFRHSQNKFNMFNFLNLSKGQNLFRHYCHKRQQCLTCSIRRYLLSWCGRRFSLM